ncbi:DUF6483 family protein [Paenibacillus sanguinis]|uniref:DUF6483 family protein n=1 Tax=Paenibacillus sanguinis TaxID=225906 RepID=UPI00037CE94B|nr:DUF6483 family protein [Paenibacillus sanguinis]
MLRRDYLVRMIEEMTEVLGKVFMLRQNKKLTEALWSLDELYKRQFRLNARLLDTLSAKDIVKLFHSGGELEADKLQSLARLLKEEGDICLAMQEEEEAGARWMKALHLYLATGLHGADRSLWNWPDAVSELQALLKSYRLPPETELLLMKLEESEGRYDQAENALYRLLAEESISKEEADAFYQRLLTLSPEQLEEGGLPLEEVREGLLELEKRFYI